MRKTKAGTMQAAVREAITAAGGLDAAANDMQISTTTLSRSTDFDESRPGGLGVNYLHQLGRLLPHAVVPIARHFATLAGGYFQPIACSKSGGIDISVVTKEFSRVLSDHVEAHSDRSENPNDYTSSEAALAIEDVDRLIEAAAHLKTALMEKAAKQRGQ